MLVLRIVVSNSEIFHQHIIGKWLGKGYFRLFVAIPRPGFNVKIDFYIQCKGKVIYKPPTRD